MPLRRGRPGLATIVLVAALAAGVGACGSSDPDAGASSAGNAGPSKVGEAPAPCTPPPVIDAPDVATKLPKGLTLPEGAEVLRVDETAGRTQVVVQSHATVSSLHERATAEVKAAGYAVTKLDDEGREAEVYFRLPNGDRGEVQQARSSCPAGTTRTIFSVERG